MASIDSRARSARWLALALLYSGALTASPAAFAQAAGAAEEGDADTAAAEEKAADDAAAAEAAEAEAAMDEESTQAELRRAPAKGKAVIWGTVKDTKFNEGVVEAQVQVVGRKEKTLADVNGGYRLELPPGKYNIRVSYELHRPARVDAVEVKADQVVRVDFKLVPDESSIEEVVIEEEADLNTTEGQNLGRKRAAVASDGVGRAEIARTPDRNAADAAKRVVGATIVEDRYVYVRGLGERYTNALLNGAPLPSTEPDRNTVPLDLFPSLVLESLNIVKQFTPDMPADFAGGSVRIATREFPKQPLFQIVLGGGYDTKTTFRSRPTYWGSSRDWLGYDGGRRSFPDGIPDRKLDSAGATEEERITYAHKFNSAMGTQTQVTPPNYSLSLVAGNAYKLGSDTKVGGIAALTYGRRFLLRKISVRRFYTDVLPDGTPTLLTGDDFKGLRSVESVNWGAFGSFALEHKRNTTVRLIAFRSQSADDQTNELEGTLQGNPTQKFHTGHLEFVSRALNFLQLGGEHHFPKQNDLQIDWYGSLAIADRDQPDTRDWRYAQTVQDGVEGWKFIGDNSGQHAYLAQKDKTFNGGLDVTQPLGGGAEHAHSIKVGTLVTSRRRSFRARRFQLVPPREPDEVYDTLSFCPGAQFDRGCPNRLFRREAIGPNGLTLDEWTLNFDQYESGLDVYSVYGMIDTKPIPNLRVIGGVRSEITYQSFAGFDPFDRTGTEVRAAIYQADYLPALSAVYSLGTKTNVRFGASQTIARPQLRELSPALATTYSGDLSVQGNPELKLTKITNLDLRYEYFPTLKESLALSVFYKHFKHPIEEIVGGTGLLNFANAPKADLYGVELEARKTLDVLADVFKDFTIIGNLTLVKSTVELGSSKGSATNSSRPLSYQSPYVVNLSLDYENQRSGTDFRVLYNVFGPRITVVGALDLPDTYELPRNQVDVSAAQKLGKNFQLKFVVNNLLAQPFIQAYRNVDAYHLVRNADGSRLYESQGRNPTVKRYDPGAIYNLTLSYTY